MAARLGFLPDGDLIGAGSAPSHDVVVRLSGATGAEVWQHPMFDPSNLIVDGGLAADGVVGVGGRHSAPGVNGLFALKFATRLAGRNLVVQQDEADPAKNRLVLGARDTRLIVSRADGGPQDPTVHGGVFELSNPVTGETATFPLPAGSWTALPGNKPGRERYRYRDSSGTTPCTKVIMKTAKTVTVECRGPLMTFTLDEPSQGSLRATLRLGSGGPDLCFEFGGTVRDDVGTGATGKGLFAAKDAPPPTTCPGGF